MTDTERTARLNAAITKTPYSWLASTITGNGRGLRVVYSEVPELVEANTDLGPYALYLDGEPLADDATDELASELKRAGATVTGTSDELAITMTIDWPDA